MNALIGIESGVLRGVEILKKSVEIISDFTEIAVISSVIRSSQKNSFESSEDFLSIVIKINIIEDPEALIKRMMQLEQYFLGEYFSKYFRAVLLTYGEQMNLVPHLVLPHPQLIQNKAFLIGSVEIWGGYSHPILGKQLHDILTNTDLNEVEFISPGKSLFGASGLNPGGTI